MKASFFLVCGLSACIDNASGSSGSSPDAGYELLATSMGPEVPRTCSSAPHLPAWVHGSFFISGPAKFEMGGISFNSLFDGYGRVNRFEMRSGEVCFTSAWLNTSYYQAAEKLGTIGPGVLFEGTTPARPSCPTMKPWCDLLGPMDNNWVNLLPTTAGEGLLLTDAPNMLRFNLETLAVTGENEWVDVGLDWKYHRATTGSAHPVLRPGTKSTFVEITSMIPIMPMAGNYLAVYTIDSTEAKTRTLIASVPTKHMQYLHSFGITENYVVLPCNLAMGISSATFKHRIEMVDAFEDGWDGIHVVDLKGVVTKFETEKFYHVHIANTFENDTGIVMDLGTSDVIPFSDGPLLTTAKFLNKTIRDAMTKANLNVLHRYHLHTAGELKGSVTKEVLSVPGRASEFFKVSPLINGKPYCFIYMNEWFHDDKSYASMAVVKQDLCKGTRQVWNRTNTYPGEQTFIPNEGEGLDEDDGVVVFPALDGDKRHSLFVVLDAKTFEELAVVDLPTHIPFTAHGQFVPALKKVAALAIANTASEGAGAAAETWKDALVV